MNNATPHKPHYSIPTLLAVGGSLVALPAGAVQLGDLTVHSRLGDPLRASIAYALGPNESITSSCVSIAPVANGWPGIGRASVRISNGAIVISGDTTMREPMASTRVVVNCPYAAKISREYMLFIDPPAYVAPQATTATPAAVPAAPAATASEPQRRAPVRVSAAATEATSATPQRSAPVASTPVASTPISGRYQVQRGDNLSQIVERIEGRTMGLWPAVDAIVAANPTAFIDGDPNRLKAGSWLDIPAVVGGAVGAAEAAPAVAASPVAEPVFEPVVELPADSTQLPETTADLQPATAGDNSFVSDNPFVDTTVSDESTTNVIIPDTALDTVEVTSSSPNVTTAVAVPQAESTINESQTATSNWVYWLAGGGVLAILALLLFGRRLRGTPEPVAVMQSNPMRRATDTATVETLVVEESDYNPDDYDLEDDAPTEENLVLDADLVTGSGLSDGTEVDVSQNFGYAAPAVVDVELPFEPTASVDPNETDMLPAPSADASSILESESLPEDDDYDMSVIVDATKMPQPEDITEPSLKAVELPDTAETAITDSYTISREIDYEILEQDYEDELTATQALNKEIARAAAELTDTMEKEQSASDASAETAVLPMASVTELDVTSAMPAANSDEVVELDATAEMPASDDEDDETANMQVESGKLG